MNRVHTMSAIFVYKKSRICIKFFNGLKSSYKIICGALSISKLGNFFYPSTQKIVKTVGNFSLNKKNNKKVNYLVAVISVLLLAYFLGLSTPFIKNYFLVASSPIQKVLWTAGASSSFYFSSFLNSGSLAMENKNIKEENQRLLFEISSLQSKERGTQEFSQISATCQSKGFDVAIAGVIGLETNDVLSINKGSADGISEGMPVINQQSVLFGKISRVYKSFSEVTLLSNKDSIVNVKIQRYTDTSLDINSEQPPEINGVVRGLGGLSAYLDLIPINSDINLQEVLVTSSMDKDFPKDMLVGRITQKQKDDQKPFQQAEIDLFSDIFGLENLFVITNYKQTD